MSELAYSPEKLIQDEVDHAYHVELTPHNSILPGNNLIFHLEGGSDFTDLSNTYLAVEIQMTSSDGAAVDAGAKACPINNIFHSMWSQIQVRLKDCVISHPSPNYAYRAYLENLLNYSKDSKETWMENIGFYMDQPAAFDSEANTALPKRRDLITGKKTLRLKGKLSTDVGAQPLLIPSHTDITLTLTPQRPEFLIQNFDVANTSYKIDILSAKLSVRKVKLYPSKVAEFEKQIAKAPIRLPIAQVKVTTVSIPSGMSSYHQNSIFSGELPNYVVIGLVKNESYTGTPNKNPFNFVHETLNYIQLKVNEQLIPTYAITPKFADANFTEAYESLYHVIGRHGQDWSNGLTLSDYKGGSALYGFTLNNDTLCRHDSVNLQGQVDITLKFDNALNDTMTIVIYSSTMGNIIIDQHRNVLLDI